MALLTDELEKTLTKHFPNIYNSLFERIINPMGMATWWTTSSTTTSSSSSNTYYYYTTNDYNYVTPKTYKTKEPDYIPSDEPGLKRKIEQDFKFDTKFLDLEE